MVRPVAHPNLGKLSSQLLPSLHVLAGLQVFFAEFHESDAPNIYCLKIISHIIIGSVQKALVIL